MMKLKDLSYIIPISALLGFLLANTQYGSILKGTFAFGLLIFLTLLVLVPAIRWSGAGKIILWMVALTFLLRMSTAVLTYNLLPINGYKSTDDFNGFVFTDAHNRDSQAWRLADIDRSIWDAFDKKYSTDQYGGLLALMAVVYRYLSLDFQRPLLLASISALVTILALPFMWKSITRLFGEKVAIVSCWIFVFYPESVLLGSAAMREPYLMTFSALALWGFVDWRENHNNTGWFWLGLAALGMILVSPAALLITAIIFMGWIWFTSQHDRRTWLAFFGMLGIFFIGILLLGLALNRQGNLRGTPLNVVITWVREVVLWGAFQSEKLSGWLQKLLNNRSPTFRVVFIAIYGMLQPVLPAAIFEPTTRTWQVVAILRALGWYVLIPALIFSFVAAANQQPETKRRLWLWLSSIVWIWILITALRGGGDQWDNPRYRAFLMLWQSLLAGYAVVRWYETRNAWLTRILAMEGVFLLFFGQWYAARYLEFGFQISFGAMIALIVGSWVSIMGLGIWRDKRYVIASEQ